jgi:hypothetical protein
MTQQERDWNASISLIDIRTLASLPMPTIAVSKVLHWVVALRWHSARDFRICGASPFPLAGPLAPSVANIVN